MPHDAPGAKKDVLVDETKKVPCKSVAKHYFDVGGDE